jgi:hypothetical protein
VIGEHEWFTGRCHHSDLTADDMHDHTKKPLLANSPAMTFLRKIVLDPKLTHSLHYYSRCQ